MGDFVDKKTTKAPVAATLFELIPGGVEPILSNPVTVQDFTLLTTSENVARLDQIEKQAERHAERKP
jgi:hypothetical protein